MRKIFVFYLGKYGALDTYVCHFETRAFGKRNVFIRFITDVNLVQIALPLS